MTELFASGRVVDVALALVVVEFAVLCVLRARFARGPAPLEILPTLLAGGFVLLALRASLTGGGEWTIAVCLALALVAHGVDLARRRPGA